MGVPSASGQSQPRKVAGVASPRQSPVAAVWSPTWQGPPRVTELRAQIPAGLIQTDTGDYSSLAPTPSDQSPFSFRGRRHTGVQRLPEAESGLQEGILSQEIPTEPWVQTAGISLSPWGLSSCLGQALGPRLTRRRNTGGFLSPSLSDSGTPPTTAPTGRPP